MPDLTRRRMPAHETYRESGKAATAGERWHVNFTPPPNVAGTSMQPEPRHLPPVAWLAARPVEMQASHLELNVEPGSHLRNHSFL